MSLPPVFHGLSLTDPRCAEVLNALADATDCPPAGAPQGVNEAASSLATPAVSGQRAGTRWAAFSAEEQACLLVALALLGLGDNSASSYVDLALRLQAELNAVWEA